MVFQGLIVRAPLRTARARLRQLETPLTFRGGSFGVGLSVLFPEENALDLECQFEELEIVAGMCSDFFPLLVVSVDTRVEGRYCIYFQDGDPVEAFGLEQEFYMPLNDHGEPLKNAKKVPRRKLAKHQEYAVVEHALDLGFKRLGGGSWAELQTFIQRHL